MSEFLAMNGYGAFIWPAYGVALVGLAGVVLRSFLRLRRAERAR